METKKGFTLIELLVVITIIGILATVIVINITGAQQRARRNAAVSNLNEALKVAQGCLADEGYIFESDALNGAEDGYVGRDICVGSASSLNAKWPLLGGDYHYSVTIPKTGVSDGKDIGISITVIDVAERPGDENIQCEAVDETGDGVGDRVLSCR